MRKLEMLLVCAIAAVLTVVAMPRRAATPDYQRQALAMGGVLFHRMYGDPWSGSVKVSCVHLPKDKYGEPGDFCAADDAAAVRHAKLFAVTTGN
jgi:hypothetical protein